MKCMEAGTVDETYYPYQFVEHFGCVRREIGGWTVASKVFGARWEILAMRRLEGRLRTDRLYFPRRVLILSAYLIVAMPSFHDHH